MEIMAALSKVTKNNWTVHFKWMNFMKCKIISIKLLKRAKATCIYEKLVNTYNISIQKYFSWNCRSMSAMIVYSHSLEYLMMFKGRFSKIISEAANFTKEREKYVMVWNSNLSKLLLNKYYYNSLYKIINKRIKILNYSNHFSVLYSWFIAV